MGYRWSASPSTASSTSSTGTSAEKRLSVNACGLYDLDRKIRPVGESYKMMIEEFGQITIVPHAEMFEFTSRPATLKVEK